MKQKLKRGVYVRVLLANTVSGLCLLFIASRQYAAGRAGATAISITLGLGLIASGVLALAKGFSGPH